VGGIGGPATRGVGNIIFSAVAQPLTSQWEMATDDGRSLYRSPALARSAGPHSAQGNQGTTQSGFVLMRSVYSS
jgi:hypothetical protein